jgi:hypothetical protein
MNISVCQGVAGELAARDVLEQLITMQRCVLSTNIRCVPLLYFTFLMCIFMMYNVSSIPPAELLDMFAGKLNQGVAVPLLQFIARLSTAPTR